MQPAKPTGGRPKHIVIYESGPQAQNNFLAGMRALLVPAKDGKRQAKKDPKRSGNTGK